jgi:formylglycine-generating enzyme required for sulfatase activity
MKLHLIAALAATVLLGGQAKPDREFTECPQCSPMVAIPAGKFLMGSPAHEPGRFDSEGPQHVVTIRAFALAKYPVTSAEFLAFLNATGYQPQQCNPLLNLGWHQLGRGLAATPTDVEPPRWPAVCLDWKDAEAYIAWINAKARAAHPEIGNRNPYRLPSEAEWEYAARAGAVTRYPRGDGPGHGEASCDGCRSRWDLRQTAPVGSFKPNAFGLYDMQGNVWEWVEDAWHDNYDGALKDASEWASGDPDYRVARGGSWRNDTSYLRAAAREKRNINVRFDTLGFRVGRTLSP